MKIHCKTGNHGNKISFSPAISRGKVTSTIKKWFLSKYI